MPTLKELLEYAWISCAVIVACGIAVYTFMVVFAIAFKAAQATYSMMGIMP